MGYMAKMAWMSIEQKYFLNCQLQLSHHQNILDIGDLFFPISLNQFYLWCMLPFSNSTSGYFHNKWHGYYRSKWRNLCPCILKQSVLFTHSCCRLSDYILPLCQILAFVMIPCSRWFKGGWWENILWPFYHQTEFWNFVLELATQ